MTIELTRPGKNTLLIESPVMPASGTFGYGEVYRDLINIEKLGAIVTNPITYEGWSPASGGRVVSLSSGVLVHTGLPNPGLTRAIRQHQNLWKQLPVPVIVHIVATTADHVRKCASRIDEVEGIAAIELGLGDDTLWEDAVELVEAAISKTEKPVLVRLPMQNTYELADAVADAGAGALVIAAPPRGTARDPLTGKLVSGRIYSPVIKPMILHMVGQLVRRLDVPIIGAGGIHSTQDARDYIDAGARAVQLDSVTWIYPRMLERIARDLSTGIVTRQIGALADEWHPDMGDTERQELRRGGNSMPSLTFE